MAVTFRNVSPLGALHIPVLGLDVDAGETFTVEDEAVAASLAEQAGNFEKVEE